VTCILQSSDGYIWIGTGNGLARFDGARFVIFNMSNTEELKGHDVTQIFEDKDKNIWIFSIQALTRFKDGLFEDFTYLEGIKDVLFYPFMAADKSFCVFTQKGVLRFKGDHFEFLRTKPGFTLSEVNCYSWDSHGQLFIGTDNGAKKFKETGFAPIEGTGSFTVRFLYHDQQNNLWMGTDNGLKRLKNGGLESFDLSQEPFTVERLTQIEEDRNGSFWLSTRDSYGLFRCGEEERVFLKEKSLPADEFISSIEEDRKGNIWIGTKNGLFRYQNGKFDSLKKENGLADDFIRVVYEDREENLWLCTHRGLTRLKNPRVVTFSKEEGQSCEIPRSIFQDRQGRIWIMGDGEGLVRFDQGKFEKFKSNLPAEFPFDSGCFFEDRQGNFWLGPTLSRYKEEKFEIFRTKDGETIKNIHVITDDRDGRLWLGTLEGIVCIESGEATFYSTEDGLSNNIVYEIKEALDGTLWIGTNRGLTLYKNGVFQTIHSPEALSEKAIMDIYQDEEGTIWLGTYGGLYRYREGTFFRYTSRDGMPDDAILGILEDGKQNLWMSSIRGIFSLGKKELDDYASGRIRSLLPMSFDRTDGMKIEECNGGRQPSCLKASDGRLWFPTMKGVVVADPNNLGLNLQPPPVYIENVVMDEKNIVVGDAREIVVPPGKTRFEFHYTAINFFDPKKVKFRYRLEGYDKQWLEHGAEKERIAHYMNVLGGAYRFCVIASNNDNIWNKTGASMDVRIIRSFAETFWFKALVLCGSVLFVFLIFNFIKRYFYLFAFWKKRRYVSHYVIDKIIGYGGMATVFLAHHMLNKKKIVAVKILKREFAARSSSLKRFKKEGAIIDTLDHPHIVKTFERGQHEDNFYIAMEYLEGQTLAEKIKEEERIEKAEFLDITLQLVEVLAAIHRRNIIHRDLKPANIMLVNRDGQKNFVKLLDFGLARGLYHTQITESGSLLGTIHYIPPEQISHSIFSPSGDIYALGMICYEMLTGTTPYPDSSELEIMQKKLNESPVELAAILPHVPSAISQLIIQMTALSPKERPTADRILDILKLNPES